MMTSALDRFRAGLRAKRFTMTRVAELSNIPLTTLSDMADPEWGSRIFNRLAALEQALEVVEHESSLAKAGG